VQSTQTKQPQAIAENKVKMSQPPQAKQSKLEMAAEVSLLWCNKASSCHQL
jgi:hypothetical protein